MDWGIKLKKIREYISQPRSIVFVCVVYFMIYAVVILLVYSSVQYVIGRRMTTAFPSMSNLLLYQSELMEENYAQIPELDFPNSSYMVFDEEGNVIYSSNRSTREVIRSQDLLFMNEYNSQKFYSVYKRNGYNGKTFFRIQYSEYDEETGLTTLLGECVLDDQLEKVTGTLFPDKNQLTFRELAFLQGLYSESETISKYNYYTTTGEFRTVVFIAPKFSEDAYNIIVNDSRMMWLLLIPVISIGAIVCAVLVGIKIKRTTNELNRVIRMYRESNTFSVDRTAVLFEYRDTIDTLDVLLQKVEKTNEEKKRLLADISHDLKTPLTVISGCARAFENGLVSKDQEEKYIKMISEKARVATDLLDTLYEYSKMDHPHYQATCKKVDMCEFTKRWCIAHYAEIEEAGYQLDVSIPDEKIDVWLDEKLFRRSFANLLNNALQHNKSGTTIYVKVKREPTSVVITIADNGKGICEQLRPQVFEPFVTGDTARSTGSGTGLGLAIVKKIVEIHRGKIQLKVPPQEPYATEFEIKLPLYKKEDSYSVKPDKDKKEDRG